MIPWLALILIAIVIETLGYFDGKNVVTLSRVVWWLDERWRPLRWLILAFFALLWIHWFVV